MNVETVGQTSSIEALDFAPTCAAPDCDRTATQVRHFIVSHDEHSGHDPLCDECADWIMQHWVYTKFVHQLVRLPIRCDICKQPEVLDCYVEAL